LAVSLESTALPAITIIVGIVASYQLAGLFGIAIATTTMLGVAGMIVALDAFGPVTDNAGGIAEMAEMDEKIRGITDPLDYRIGENPLAKVIPSLGGAKINTNEEGAE
jgi:K(+)-stimulated pyrophosphate-energized sodium pump